MVKTGIEHLAPTHDASAEEKIDFLPYVPDIFACIDNILPVLPPVPVLHASFMNTRQCCRNDDSREIPVAHHYVPTLQTVFLLPSTKISPWIFLDKVHIIKDLSQYRQLNTWHKVRSVWIPNSLSMLVLLLKALTGIRI